MSLGNKDLLKATTSLCPECKKKINAGIFEENGKFYIEKTCDVHGYFKKLYFGDAKIYRKFELYTYDGKGIKNPNEKFKTCSFSCGLCDMHKTHTALLNLVATNRCNARCFYCFFYAKRGGNVYEPTLKQIDEMLKTAREERPVAPIAIQITGGNPEMRDDLIEIVKLCKKNGFQHIQLNAHGTRRLYNDLNFVTNLRNAGVNVLYLSFDCVSKEKNYKNHWEIPYILENCRKVNLGVVLVPTIINTYNDDDIGKIINFALNNMDIVRGVNFQPVSFVGSMMGKDIERQRITVPDVINKLEEQSNSTIKADDFFPIPVVTPISEFIETLTGKEQYIISNHFTCGAATYLFLDENNKIIPLPEFLDVKGLMNYLKEKNEEIRKNRLLKPLILGKMLLDIGKFINQKKQPKNLNFAKLMFDVLVMHNYGSLGKIHIKSLFVGIMHFMDLYNYDVERVKRCSIHYITPEKKIIPFCVFNVLPEIYRDKSQAEHSISVEEWEKKNNKNLDDEIYKRDVEKLENSEIYRKTYNNLRNFFV